MASLTDQLSTDVGGGKPVRQAPESSSGLASVFKGAANLFDTVGTSARRAKQDRRQAAEDAYKAEDRMSDFRVEQAYRQAVADAAKPGELNIAMINKNDLASQLFDTSGDPMPDDLDASVRQTVDKLSKVQVAVTQGRMPGISFNAALNQRYLELINQYPTHAESIRKAFNERGLNASLSRVGTDEQDAHENERENQQSVENEAYKVGMSSLDPAISATMPREQIILHGFRQQKINYDLQLAAQQANLTLSNVNITKAEKEAAEKDRDDAIGQTAIVEAFNQSGPIMTSLQRLSEMIGKAPVGEQQKMFEQFAPQFDQWSANFKASYIAKAVAAGYSPDKINTLGTTIDGLVSRARGLWSGDFSVAQSNQRALTALSTAVKMDAAKTMPVFFALQQLQMKPAEIQAASDAIANNTALEDALRREMSGFTGEFGEEKASTHLVNIVRMLKGEVKLEEFTPQKARELMPTLWRTTNNLAVQYANGNEGVSTDKVLNGVGQIINAARSLDPSNADLDSFALASGGVGAPDTRRALIRALKDPDHNDQAEATIMGSRAASASLLDNMRGSVSSADTPFWTLKYNSKTGRYRSNFNEAAWKKSVARTPTGSGRSLNLGFEMTNPAPPPEPPNMRKLANTLNTNIINLTELNKYDPNGIKNVSPLEIANFYAADITPASMKGEGKKPIDPHKEIDAAIQNVQDAFSHVPDLNAPVAITVPRGTGVSRGERNNNHGNIEYGPFAKSMGATGSDGRFAIFPTPEAGNKAQETLLSRNYIDKGHNTVSKIIWRYGNDPGTGDDTNVQNYVNYVARRLGVGPDDTLSTATVSKLAQAMREFETGSRGKGVL